MPRAPVLRPLSYWSRTCGGCAVDPPGASPALVPDCELLSTAGTSSGSRRETLARTAQCRLGSPMYSTRGSHAPGAEHPFFDPRRMWRGSSASGCSPAARGAFDRLAPPMTTPDRCAVAGLWPPEAIEAIRAASLELLARVGVCVDSPRG